MVNALTKVNERMCYHSLLDNKRLLLAQKRALFWRLAGVLIKIFYILNLPRALIYQSPGPLPSSPCWIVDHKEVYYVHTYIGTTYLRIIFIDDGSFLPPIVHICKMIAYYK